KAWRNARVVVALGALAWVEWLLAYAALGGACPRPRPRHGHGAELALADWPGRSGGAGSLVLLGSYHPSQQNTLTGKLTRAAFHSVFERARAILDGSPERSPAAPGARTSPGRR